MQFYTNYGGRIYVNVSLSFVKSRYRPWYQISYHTHFFTVRYLLGSAFPKPCYGMWLKVKRRDSKATPPVLSILNHLLFYDALPSCSSFCVYSLPDGYSSSAMVGPSRTSLPSSVKCTRLMAILRPQSLQGTFAINSLA